MIRVMVADDHNLVRQGIVSLLNQINGIQVVGQAATGSEAVELARKLTPDVVVMDITMPNLNGFEATMQIHNLGLLTRVIILSMHVDTALVRQALRAGVKGYLLKQSITEELPIAIQAAMNGNTYLTPEVSTLFINQADIASNADPFDTLTVRERQVLRLIAEGNTNTAMANHLGISVKTVEKHRANLMAKLAVNDTAGLVRTAIRHKLIMLD
jgi:DNA-binding NarL/FixJ family response regulator